VSKRFGRNQKRKLRQALKDEQAKSMWAIENLNREVKRLRQDNFSLSSKKDRLDHYKIDVVGSLKPVCGSQAHAKALKMRQFIEQRVCNRSRHQDRDSFVMHLKKTAVNSLLEYLSCHVKVEEMENDESGDIIIKASIIAESRTP
jgi:hypothetical protein